MPDAALLRDLVAGGALAMTALAAVLYAGSLLVRATRQPKEVATTNQLLSNLTLPLASLTELLATNMDKMVGTLQTLVHKIDTLTPQPMLDKLDALLDANNRGTEATITGMNANTRAITNMQTAMQVALTGVQTGLDTLPARFTGDWQVSLQAALDQSESTVRQKADDVLLRLDLAQEKLMGKLEETSKQVARDIAPLLADMKDALQSLTAASTQVAEIIRVAGSIMQQQQHLLDAVQKLTEEVARRAVKPEPPAGEEKPADAHD